MHIQAPLSLSLCVHVHVRVCVCVSIVVVTFGAHITVLHLDFRVHVTLQPDPQ